MSIRSLISDELPLASTLVSNYISGLITPEERVILYIQQNINLFKMNSYISIDPLYTPFIGFDQETVSDILTLKGYFVQNYIASWYLVDETPTEYYMLAIGIFESELPGDAINPYL
jgi:hypothetical protein